MPSGERKILKQRRCNKFHISLNKNYQEKHISAEYLKHTHKKKERKKKKKKKPVPVPVYIPSKNEVG